MADVLPVHGSMPAHGSGSTRGRVLIEGRVTAVRIQPADALPRYAADVEVDHSYRTIVSDQAKANRGSFAAPTSAIAMDTPDIAEGREPISPGARVTLVWQGQRTVPGVGAGTFLRCSGLLGRGATGPVIYNPRYEIISRRHPR